MRLAVLAALVLTSAAIAQDAPGLPTDGHPFAALPLDGSLVVTVTANERPGSVTGLRVFTGPSAGPLTFKCLQPVDTDHLLGLAATPNGKGLIVAAGDAGLVLLDRAAVLDGCRARSVPIALGDPTSRQGSLDVAISPDGRFAFVANEYGVAAKDSAGQDLRGHVAVVELAYDTGGVPTSGRLIARITTGGSAIAGVALSPDGQRLYVTSEIARPGARAANGRVPAVAHGGCRQGNGPVRPFGLLSVIDVAKAEAGAAAPVIAASAAGCLPVRVVVSPDGRTLWVAARGDNKVLAFSAPALESNPDHAFLGATNSGGTAPVGLALYAGGTRLAVANSNRFAGPSAKGNLALLDTTTPTARLTTTIPAGYFPRSVNVASDGRTLFLTNFNGGQVQIVRPQ